MRSNGRYSNQKYLIWLLYRPNSLREIRTLTNPFGLTQVLSLPYLPFYYEAKVSVRGFEPLCPCERCALNAVRLPFHHTDKKEGVGFEPTMRFRAGFRDRTLTNSGATFQTLPSGIFSHVAVVNRRIIPERQQVRSDRFELPKPQGATGLQPAGFIHLP